MPEKRRDSTKTIKITDMNNQALKDKKIFITGSTRGIGKAIARGMIAAGAQVWIHGRNPERCSAVAGEIGAHYLAADLKQDDQVERLIGELKALPGLDVLVNNAGFEDVMPFRELDLELFDDIFKVNMRTPVRITSAVIPMLEKSGSPSIINVTSIHDVVPVAHNGVYAMAKAALAMFTKNLAVELGPAGIRVNNFAPGAIETDMNREVIDEMGRENWKEWIPAGRVGTTDEMIGPAIFLASDASSYVNGTTLYADGAYMQNLVRYRL